MQKQGFNHAWRFHLGDNPEGGWRNLDESTWRLLDLPHDWSIELERSPDCPSGTAGGYFPMGRAWYRKTFDVPEDWRGSQVRIEFEGVYMNSEVWLNEHFIARHPYGYTSFTYDLTPYLKFGVQNSIRVLVDNASQLNSRWYSGSGIYRPVWLMVANPLHVAHWGVSVTQLKITPQAALVHVRTRIENETADTQEVTLRSTLLAPDGSRVASAESFMPIYAGRQHEFAQIIQVPDPQMWSLETPVLYQVESEVLTAGNVMDTSSTTFGIRTLHVDATKGFLLNGQPLKLKGGCVHHDNGVMGATSYVRSEERKVELLKASGFNAIRCAHNPPSPSFLDACDRLGMLVIDEAFDCWRDGKNPYDYHVAFDDWWQRDIESMVNRDRNHPCIIMWSIGNELVERGRPEGAKIARMLADHVRSLDSTRPVTAAICDSWDGWTWDETKELFATLDVGGYNYLWSKYASDHEKNPQRVMAGTESFPKEAFENWNSVLENSSVIGDFVWTSLDYLGETGIGRVHFNPDEKNFLGQYPWHQANCGDLDLCGFKRPQSYYRDILWGSGSPLYIAVHTPVPAGQTPIITQWGWPDVQANWNWPGCEGQIFTVDVYSAFDQVELFLNGKSLGLKPSGNAEKRTATFEVPYTSGELKAVGRSTGQPEAEFKLLTAGAAVQVRLTPDRPTLQARREALCYVTVEITDTVGQMHPNADQVVHFSVSGPGVLAAVGSGNPISTESYRADQRKTFQGRCLAVVQSNGTPGEIKLSAKVEGLQGAEIVIQAA